MTPDRNIKIRTDERVLIAGKTGSGKTYLARALTAPIKRLVVIDSKASLGSWRLKEPTFWDWQNFSKGKPGRFRILAPIMDDPQPWYEKLFARLYEIGDLTLYIDEAYEVTGQRSKAGKWLTALYTRGRELGIGVWASTQRPTWIPIFLISEAEVVISFRLNWMEDRKRLAQIAGEQLIRRIPDQHGFWLYRVEDENPDYFPELSS